ncbi:MAG: TlyA family RNA methyltransferase [Eubacteriales bacterium]|nr:TlyA family RNA methyltransferase [Eubacteriales bacterium]
MRLDVYLTDRGYVKSRTSAQRLIEGGYVSVDGKVIVKSSYQTEESAAVSVFDNTEYVSRGGYKLMGAIDAFGIEVKDKVAVDIGASSGGFTDCLLQNGAKFVYAIDSGKGQLAEKISSDARVESRESVNARYISKNDFDRKIDIAVMDVSFISQTLILPAVFDILETGGELVSLIKPQFEVGRGGVGKNGIVKDEKNRVMAKNKVCQFAKELGFDLIGITESPIKGGDGNTEYLAYFKKTEIIGLRY